MEQQSKSNIMSPICRKYEKIILFLFWLFIFICNQLCMDMFLAVPSVQEFLFIPIHLPQYIPA